MSTSSIPAFSDADIAKWFSYHQPTPAQVESLRVIREYGRAMAEAISAHCPAGPDTTAAMRLLRQAIMTANAAIVIPRTP